MSQVDTASAKSDITDFIEWEETLTTPQKMYHSLSTPEKRRADMNDLEEQMDMAMGLDGWGNVRGRGVELEGVGKRKLKDETVAAVVTGIKIPNSIHDMDMRGVGTSKGKPKIPNLISAEVWYQGDHDPLILGGDSGERGNNETPRVKDLRGQKSKFTPDQKKEKKAKKKAAQKEKAIELAKAQQEPVVSEEQVEVRNDPNMVSEWLEQAEAVGQECQTRKLSRKGKIKVKEPQKKGPAASPFFEQQSTRRKAKNLKRAEETLLMLACKAQEAGDIHDSAIVAPKQALNVALVKEEVQSQDQPTRRVRGSRSRKPKLPKHLQDSMAISAASVKAVPTTTTISASSPIDSDSRILHSQRTQFSGFSLKRKRELDVRTEFEDENESTLPARRTPGPDVSGDILPESPNAKPKKPVKHRRKKRARNKNKLQEMKGPVIYQLADLPDTNVNQPKPTKENRSTRRKKKRRMEEENYDGIDALKATHSGDIVSLRDEELTFNKMGAEEMKYHNPTHFKVDRSMDMHHVQDHQYTDSASRDIRARDHTGSTPKFGQINKETEVSLPEVTLNPITPPRKVSVIVYTPTKTWVPADIDDPFKPTSPHSSLIIPEQAVVGDDESEFSLAFCNENSDTDDGGKETNEILPTTRITRRASIISPLLDLDLQLDRDPVTYPKRSSSQTPKARDSKGRFTSARSLSVSPRRTRKRVSIRDSPASQMGSLLFSGWEYDSVTYPRKTVSEPSTPKFRNTKGKFASKHTDSSESTGRKRRRALSTFTESQPSVNLYTSGKKPFVTRDLHGRFVPKELNQDSSGVFAQPKNACSPVQQEVPDLLKNPDPLRYVLETMEQIARDLEALSPKPKPKMVKKKKAPAKSPYFPSPPITPSKKAKVLETIEQSDDLKTSSNPLVPPSTPKVKTESPTKRPRTPGKTISCIPFPPLSSPYFGLIQEKLAHDPFRLLIAVTFLNRTHGKHAIPVFYSLMSQYPTPESLVSAKKEDIVSVIQHLGLQNQRAATYQAYAKIWIEDPPVKGKRYPVRGYPNPNSGRDVKRDEVLDDNDEREAWEIGHMTSGPYALDSWRIFCRDEMRGVAEGWNGEGNRDDGFQPEWMRVLPEDKELRAYLRWMWLKEGFEWDPFTGEKEVAGEVLMRAALEGRIAWDDKGGMRIIDDETNLNEEFTSIVNDS